MIVGSEWDESKSNPLKKTPTTLCVVGGLVGGSFFQSWMDPSPLALTKPKSTTNERIDLNDGNKNHFHSMGIVYRYCIVCGVQHHTRQAMP